MMERNITYIYSMTWHLKQLEKKISSRWYIFFLFFVLALSDINSRPSAGQANIGVKAGGQFNRSRLFSYTEKANGFLIVRNPLRQEEEEEEERTVVRWAAAGQGPMMMVMMIDCVTHYQFLPSFFFLRPARKQQTRELASRKFSRFARVLHINIYIENTKQKYRKSSLSTIVWFFWPRVQYYLNYYY